MLQRIHMKFVICCLFLLSGCLHGFAFNGDFRQLIYNQQDGLASNTIDFIGQDAEGYLYFCTNRGLSIFDGNIFINYNAQNTPGFSNNLTVIVELDNYHLLIGSRDKGLFLFDKYKSSIRSVKGCNAQIQSVNTMLKTGKGEIWFGGDDGALWYVEDYRTLLADSDGIVFHRVTYSFPSINALAEIDGILLVATQSNQLAIIHRTQDTVIVEKAAMPFGAESSHSLLLRNGKELWVGTNSGIVVFRKKGKRWVDGSLFAEEIGLVRSMEICGDEVYIGTEGNGLFEVDSNTLSYSRTEQSKLPVSGINLNYIISLKTDHSGNLWVGTWLGGVARFMFASPLFSQSKNKENVPSLFSNVVWTVCKDKYRSGFFLGTHGSGLCHYDMQEMRFQTIDLSFRSVWTLYADSVTPFLYVGTWGEGLRLYDMETGKYMPAFPSDIEHERIYSISRFNERELFIGTSANGVWLYNEDRKQVRPLEFPGDSLLQLNVRCIQKDKEDKGYWMATFNAGLFHFDLDRSGFITDMEHFPFIGEEPVQATALFQDDKRVWICMTNGLAYLEKGDSERKVKRISQLDGYFLSDIVEGTDGNFWICSHEGLLFFNPLKLYVSRYLTEFIHYGIYSNNRDGLLIGTSEGLFSFDPAKVKESQGKGKALIRSLQMNGQAVVPDDPEGKVWINKAINYVDTLILPPGNANIGFLLSAFSPYVYGENVLFYRMEGLENYWNKTGLNNSSAVYGNLPSGKYTFHVRLNDPDNFSGEKELVIIKKEFWWNTIYARVVYCVLVLSVVTYLIFNFRKRYKKRYIRRLEDIERQKEEEVYLQKIRFFTNISHDLKTPLTLLLTPLNDLLKHPEMPETFRSRLQSMYMNGDLLLKKINKILNYRNTEGEDTALSVEVYSAHQLLYEIITPFKEYAERQGLFFNIHSLIENKVTSAIHTDRNKLESILENLISNAIKYTPEGGEVAVSYSIDNGKLELIVADTGVGIQAVALPHIFDRYYRIAPDNRGTGIGLFLVKHYVNLLEGDISVISEPGNGTTFRLSLPVVVNEMENSTDLQENGENGTLQEKENIARVLIVDDNKEMRDYLRQLFSPFYQVMEASDGKQAMEIVRMELPDIILSDLMMSKVDGLVLCRNIKGDMLTSHVPFIILSAKNSVETRLECWDAGVDLFEEKPFNSQLLLTKVANLLRSRKLLKYKYQIAIPVSVLHDEKEGGAESLEDRFLKEVNAAIDKHKDKPDLSVRELGEELHMRHDQLYRKLKTLTGLSANHYIRTYRLNCAAAMLRSKKYMVTEVLYSVGFNNPSYFTKCFKKEFGVLPSEYVAQMEDKDDSVL